MIEAVNDVYKVKEGVEEREEEEYECANFFQEDKAAQEEK